MEPRLTVLYDPKGCGQSFGMKFQGPTIWLIFDSGMNYELARQIEALTGVKCVPIQTRSPVWENVMRRLNK